MAYFRILVLTFFSILAITHSASAETAHDLLSEATYLRTDNASMAPQDVWNDKTQKPIQAMRAGEQGRYVWVMASLSSEDLTPAHNVLFSRSLVSRAVEVFVYTEGQGWAGPYPLGGSISHATHPAATTIIRLPTVFDGQHRIALKLSDPVSSMTLRGLSLISEADASQKSSRLFILYQILLTIIAIAFSYNLFLYAIYRHRFQAYYLIYTFSLLVYVGLTSQMFGTATDGLDGHQQYELRTLLYSLTAMGVYLFAAEITRTEFSKLMHRALFISAFLPLSVNIANFIFPHVMGAIRGPLYDVFGTLGLLVFFIGAAQVIPRGAPITRLVLIVFLVPTIGLAIKIGYSYMDFGPSFWIDNSVIIATAIENILVALLIAERLISIKYAEPISNTL